MKIRSAVILLLFCFALIAGCRTNSPETVSHSSGGLTVSAAVSLKDAFKEIGEIYKSKTGRKVDFNFGATGALQRQIETGAPVDVFASAGAAQMNALVSKGLIDAATKRNFAHNELVLVVPADSNLNLTNFGDLNNPGVQKIAAGNPKTVPAGEYSAQLFRKNNLSDSLQNKLIYAEDVRHVLDYVVRGEVDAGIVYASDAKSAGDKVRVVLTAPADSHEPILYPIAVVKDSANKPSAEQFIDLAMSAEGQRILQKYGFAGFEK